MTSRCLYCRRWIWPWQSRGWRVGERQTWRWHGRCYGAAAAPDTERVPPDVDEEDGDCECGLPMSAHAGGFALLHHDTVMASEGAAQAGPPPLDVLAELESYARSHSALRAGRGSTDDVLGFIDWYRAACLAVASEDSE